MEVLWRRKCSGFDCDEIVVSFTSRRVWAQDLPSREKPETWSFDEPSKAVEEQQLPCSKAL